MALTSASSISDAINQYSDNLSWEGDAAKATLALEAIRFLLVRRAQSGGISGRNWNYESLEKEKVKLETFLTESSVASAGTVGIQFHRFSGDYAR